MSRIFKNTAQNLSRFIKIDRFPDFFAVHGIKVATFLTFVMKKSDLG